MHLDYSLCKYNYDNLLEAAISFLSFDIENKKLLKLYI